MLEFRDTLHKETVEADAREVLVPEHCISTCANKLGKSARHSCALNAALRPGVENPMEMTVDCLKDRVSKEIDLDSVSRVSTAVTVRVSVTRTTTVDFDYSLF
jgi:hypothetical protein